MFVSFTETLHCLECCGGETLITYVGEDRETAIKEAQKKYNGSMVQTCNMYLETWVKGKRIETESILYTKGNKTKKIRSNNLGVKPQ